MVFKKDLIKLKKKNKIPAIRKDIKNLKYLKTIKKYKILTQVHLNYKFKKISFKNISPVNLGIFEAQHQTNCNRIVFNFI